MRPLPSVFFPLVLWGLLCLLTGVASAQQQEQKLMDRIDRPDKSRAFELQRASFSGGKGYSATGSAYVKDFYYPRTFRSKDFLTGSYAAKQCWLGDFMFATRPAYTKSDAAAEKQYNTKAMPTNSAYYAEKGYGVKTFDSKDPISQSDSRVRGHSQDKIDKLGPAAFAGPMGYEGTLAPLKTIDDVRDLLNKNK